MNNRPLVINSDNNVYLIEALDKDYDVERQLNKYATLIKMPEGIHSYILDDYSLWSAAALGVKPDDIINFLEENSKNHIPDNVKEYINKTIKVLVENESSFNIWKEEIDERTNLSENIKRVIEYNKLNSNITIATYGAAVGNLLNEINNIKSTFF